MAQDHRARLAAAPYMTLIEEENYDRAELASVGLNHVRFKRCSLVGVDLRQATLDSCWFSFCDLRRANLRGASLRFVRFAGCDLRRADLRDADLSGARFVATGDGSRWTDITGAMLDRAIADGASFDHVIGK